MNPECWGTGTPSGCAGRGSRPPPGSTAIMETSILVALDQQFLHEHGRARRHEVLEHRLACALIRIHHLRIRIILVDAHDMAKIAALRCDQLGQSRDDEIALAAIAPRTVQRVAGPAGDLRRQPVLEIACHVAGEKQP